MQKITMTLTAAALALGMMAITVATGAAGLHDQFRNATPIDKAACGGFGPHCPPGTTRVCGPNHCWCRPC